MKAPMLLGNDVRIIDNATLAVLTNADAVGVNSRRRDCHFADALIAIETPAEGRGWCSRLTVSPTAV